ncbi:hypothetical protein PACID_11830 [Acidipropionibacterium acidipropionici ATCC 4875]|uniref:Uncharacterized protein n=1 Tax=Acidipropionibacterium acidipropionici (strain ATCC 4875 / DSM 20272 / JCM 6432 / NBRC 12425 / NCIMB 8070 / 4) TaxID=1171373 RepID=K7S354_ACIA4|nr:hypothetical protein PACID_11830 [Acidipropionibacterium acidipropionici ATCC 4875]
MTLPPRGCAVRDGGVAPPIVGPGDPGLRVVSGPWLKLTKRHFPWPGGGSW